MLCIVLLLFLVYLVQCDFRNSTQTLPEFEDRIYSGYNAGIDQYPYATLLSFEATIPSSCGGSLIMVQAVLTAAHCVDELRYKRGKIYAYFGAVVPKHSKAVREVKDYAINPKYNENNGKSNIAVAFRSYRAPLQYLIKKIPLTDRDPEEGDIVLSVGWGKQQVQRPYKLPDLPAWRSLKGTKQIIVSRRSCSQITGYKMSPATICSKPEIGHLHLDDSGDGLILKKPVLMLAGVLSYVTNEASVHTSVIANRDWIINTCYSLYVRNCQG